eukprot:6055730-Lingulodinium_polyedra.AAC.1
MLSSGSKVHLRSLPEGDHEEVTRQECSSEPAVRRSPHVNVRSIGEFSRGHQFKHALAASSGQDHLNTGQG